MTLLTLDKFGICNIINHMQYSFHGSRNHFLFIQLYCRSGTTCILILHQTMIFFFFWGGTIILNSWSWYLFSKSCINVWSNTLLKNASKYNKLSNHRENGDSKNKNWNCLGVDNFYLMVTKNGKFSKVPTYLWFLHN